MGLGGNSTPARKRSSGAVPRCKNANHSVVLDISRASVLHDRSDLPDRPKGKAPYRRRSCSPRNTSSSRGEGERRAHHGGGFGGACQLLQRGTLVRKVWRKWVCARPIDGLDLNPFRAVSTRSVGAAKDWVGDSTRTWLGSTNFVEVGRTRVVLGASFLGSVILSLVRSRSGRQSGSDPSCFSASPQAPGPHLGDWCRTLHWSHHLCCTYTGRSVRHVRGEHRVWLRLSQCGSRLSAPRRGTRPHRACMDAGLESAQLFRPHALGRQFRCECVPRAHFGESCRKMCQGCSACGERHVERLRSSRSLGRNTCVPTWAYLKRADHVGRLSNCACRHSVMWG